MCNACGNVCCGSDQFGGCGCDGCHNEACWPAACDCGDPLCEGCADLPDDVIFGPDFAAQWPAEIAVPLRALPERRA